jgi:hypothetical protein
VKVSIVRGGGIGGIATRTELASEALPEDARRRLETLAASVVPAASARAAHPDETRYRVTVDTVSATYTESSLPPPVRELIEFVRARPERQDALER